jgi:poly(3-hydroxybutyrate) depolymerase
VFARLTGNVCSQIQSCVAALRVDPDRVHLLGYSAGGDAVYRLVSAMPGVFASACMCAGHPNGVGVDNFMHVPLLLQVGELDTSYNRHLVTAQVSLLVWLMHFVYR